MSGLSHKSHGELNQITSKIMLNEVSGDGVNTGVGGAILGGVANAIKFGNTARKFAQAKGRELYKYGQRELSPIIKRNLKLDPKKPLAQGLLDAGAKATTDIGSKLVRDAGKTVNTLSGTAYRQARFVGKKLAPAVPLAGAAYGVGEIVNDLQKPPGKSGIKKFFKNLTGGGNTQKEEVEVLSEEFIAESTEYLYHAITGYLLETKLADDLDRAHTIMENMSDEWAEEIIQKVVLADDE